ncbi:MAG: Methyl-accepting chemotaxis protein [uncultured Thiotrichaceae bacterium]|uniref:Methyl-accepting chemotaxis protein n=1 Tax=uncultured Thiotrichaceae bacterium TaxID=298394 RepID=A0A6S6S2P0_9GAMM|nr:MAG: Methyl-accepting chemotaxis protein [uncultured Thiotrichaceae bacterium]
MSDIIKKRASFLENQTVSRRISMLILIPLTILLVVGIFSANALNNNRMALHDINQRVATIHKVDDMILELNRDYIRPLYQVQIGSKTWDDGLQHLQKLETFTNNFIQYYNNEKSLNNVSENWQALDKGKKLLVGIEKARALLQEENRYKLELYLQNDLVADYEPLRDNLYKEVQNDINLAGEAFLVTENNIQTFLAVGIVMTLLGMIFAVALGYFIYRSVSSPIKKLSNTMTRVSDGDLQARVELAGKNELVELGNHFDKMLDERIATQVKIDHDHQELNQSVFRLLQTVAELSERNLTVRAEVTEDATGPVADALNLLAEETSETLTEVRDVATEVQSTSENVKTRLVSVNKLATQEQEHAEQTAFQIDKMLKRLDEIATSASETNEVAHNTTISTKKAHQSVTGTVEGMADIRETVQDTGKRIKQLGERSQEISYIIDIINTIAERTTVLALNASMQAVAAGDAGRGFSVIADEIQRLAESSRESTGQISTLVRNIQQETNTTIATMDKTIEQVIDGSTRAEDAAQQMKEVLENTSQLVQSVEQIASSSHEQVNISNELKQKAESIMQSTKNTGREISFLTGLSHNMSDFAQKLVQTVNVFTLEKGKSAKTTEELEEVKA